LIHFRAALAALLLTTPTLAAQPPYDERPARLRVPDDQWDYSRREAEIPMRDGVKLHTVILVPKGARNAPILLTRTPYNADALTQINASARLATVLDGYDNPADLVVEGKYIRVVQDVRGKYGSGGTYVMNRPLAGQGLNPTNVDDSTDAYDTIDYLVKNLPESNGRVGILGISYDGFTALMALVNPHPALKVAVPMNPMVDGWRGDDWFHNGAFRQLELDYIFEQVGTRDNSRRFHWSGYDVFDEFLRAGNAATMAADHGLDQIGFWQKILAHPAYDSFWQSQAMDRILASRPLTVPTMLVHGLWDQEDIYGAPAVWKAVQPQDRAHNLWLSFGPWYHGQQIDQGSRTGQVRWDQETAKWWRANVLGPFLARYLKDTPADVARVTAFQSGTNRWQRLASWPPAGGTAQRLYLQPDGKAGFQPTRGRPQAADYVSDPAHPVPFVQRPVRPIGYDDDHWTGWLTSDQRNASTRPDVLTFVTEPLSEPLAIAGEPMVHLTASTSGTDSDWVVKLIDVYPDTVPIEKSMGGYQLAVAMDIFRGRYRDGFAEPKPLKPNTSLNYRFALPTANHVFLPGHRIMVQVQSSWFPLYDRNPQVFVPSIFTAKPEFYRAAQQRVTVAGQGQSFIELPLAPAAAAGVAAAQ